MSKTISKLFMTGGLLLIAAALLLTVYNFWDERRAGDASTAALELLLAEIKPTVEASEPILTDDIPETAAEMGTEVDIPADVLEETEDAVPSTAVIPDYVLDPEMDMPVIVSEADGTEYIGVLSIPSLELYLPVIGDWSYEKLKLAPCVYEGSVYTDDAVIMAHNYRVHFGPISRLRAGDVVDFRDSMGNAFSYTVVESETVDENDRERMVTGDWDLTLFTCTMSGRTRLAVRCERTDK